MIAPQPPLQRQDWIRFQVLRDKRVLEGYVQEVSEDGRRIKIGKDPDGVEHQWYFLADISLLQRQTLLAFA